MKPFRRIFIFLGLYALIPLLCSASNGSAASFTLQKYDGPVRHIFFHSLIIYPDLASKSINAGLYANNMITVDEFISILDKLYKNGFILIDPHSLYQADTKGKLHPTTLYLPTGKKPLVISQDDVNYYPFMNGSGFADRLVLDQGRVKAQVTTPAGQTITTFNGDVVPIIDSFVATHPDFSFHGAKGVLAVTGFKGVLGYRTQSSSPSQASEKIAVAPVIEALKNEGWIFASHSYFHDHSFLNGTTSTSSLAEDTKLWKDEVGTLVGPTDIYVGPFGQLFKPNDARRAEIAAAGFHILYGVGVDGYIGMFKDYVVIDRINIDGYRLRNSAKTLHDLLGI